MFTGIVEEVGRVKSFDKPLKGPGVGRLSIEAVKVMGDLNLGDNISVNGACLTVVDLEDGSFVLEVAPETFRRTTFGSLVPGCGVNLERPISATGRLGGHIVQGHVDATGKVIATRPEGECTLIKFRGPKKQMPYMVDKGFVAIDGVSLTVVKKGASSFTISVVPYTLKNTTLNERRVGDSVNVEVDILSKYVESLLNR